MKIYLPNLDQYHLNLEAYLIRKIGNNYTLYDGGLDYREVLKPADIFRIETEENNFILVKALEVYESKIEMRLI